METAILNAGYRTNADVLLNAYYQIVRLHLTMEERLVALEDGLGAKLPADYASFLGNHRSTEPLNAAIAAHPDGRDVRTLYEFADGPIHLQIDKVYRLLADALPPSMLPIAEDTAGNYYCLATEGDQKGQVLLLNEAQNDGGTWNAEAVAPSFATFLQKLMSEASRDLAIIA